MLASYTDSYSYLSFSEVYNSVFKYGSKQECPYSSYFKASHLYPEKAPGNTWMKSVADSKALSYKWAIQYSNF